VPYFPRFRALALLGRRPTKRVAGLVNAGVGESCTKVEVIALSIKPRLYIGRENPLLLRPTHEQGLMASRGTALDGLKASKLPL
jgi:hypothetical protein